jgi:hypothetical protein
MSRRRSTQAQRRAQATTRGGYSLTPPGWRPPRRWEGSTLTVTVENRARTVPALSPNVSYRNVDGRLLMHAGGRGIPVRVGVYSRIDLYWIKR